MTRQTFFNLAALALLALLVLNTASIARSLRRIERKGRHPTPIWFVMKAPTLEGGPRANRVCARCPNWLDVTTLPLWMWTHQRTLPTLQACERYRGTNTLMRCIASDDPRLKEK
jgi:hypothetical protein